jgi:hypothetical protein
LIMTRENMIVISMTIISIYNTEPLSLSSSNKTEKDSIHNNNTNIVTMM